LLDTDTKRRIDTARDILVGKVPDPKSQVEQITIALIYKFMDDMDAESEELGGKRKFFTGDFGRFGWARLMDPRLGGHEMLGLYSEGISRMPENPGMPPLFRDIFKNAYLPYRDPETLKAFLKIINEFSYDHSERLGDAFEYLLSVLGSQGDAGQFRTPRHIIDFMVDVIDPKKTEKVLDPACGTAGFLISSYKHILKANLDLDGQSTLTPDERGALAQNFKGYDISPDMVRLSLVNMYLHGFTDPHIYEYDTLTSEDRWTEFADVILANPPFMSPKGGIKPHKRFTIQAKRSEVLFVDYMAEHLTPGGRAAIIVPEGIIFQSQGAYKDLRKSLVENSLVAVVSLPAGCFNPYSGVKTSILFLDKPLARQSDTIAFFKVENDGFGLGAQRRAFDKNDLPQVKVELNEYLQTLRTLQSTIDLQPTCGLIVRKTKIAENGDYNFSGERYRVGTARNDAFPIVSLGDICEIIMGQSPPGETYNTKGDGVPLINGPVEFGPEPLSKTIVNQYTTSPTKMCKEGDLILCVRGSTTGRMNIAGYSGCIGRGVAAIRSTTSQEWVNILINSLRDRIYDLGVGSTFPNITAKDLAALKIPLPPPDVQKAIVAEIAGYQKVIDGARAVLDNYRPHIPIHPDWPMVQLQELCLIKSGATPDRSNNSYWNGDIPWVTTTLINYEIIVRANEYITVEGLEKSSTWVVPKGTVLMAMYGQGVTRGRVAILGIDAAINQACAAFQIKHDSLDSGYLFRVLQSRYEDLRQISDARGGNQSNLSAQVLKEYSIPLPPLATQQAIVAEIEAEQSLVAANRELIALFEKKIQATLARIWGEEEPVAKED